MKFAASAKTVGSAALPSSSSVGAGVDCESELVAATADSTAACAAAAAEPGRLDSGAVGVGSVSDILEGVGDGVEGEGEFL